MSGPDARTDGDLARCTACGGAFANAAAVTGACPACNAPVAPEVFEAAVRCRAETDKRQYEEERFQELVERMGPVNTAGWLWVSGPLFGVVWLVAWLIALLVLALLLLGSCAADCTGSERLVHVTHGESRLGPPAGAWRRSSRLLSIFKRGRECQITRILLTEKAVHPAYQPHKWPHIHPWTRH